MIKKIVVCGLGKLGSPIAAVLANSGFEIAGLDLDQKKVDAINEGMAPVQEQGLGELIARATASKNLRATRIVKEATKGSDACIFITPTPSLPDGSFDNGPLFKAIESVVTQGVWTNTRPYLFIVASTVTPGTCKDQIVPLIAKSFSKPFHLIYKPEFIALGSVVRDLRNPDFHLIGESSPAAGDMAMEIYHNRVKRMSLIEAELAKISLNCFVTMKISFANQLNMVADILMADSHKILEAIGEDRRIGSGALKPGLPFGGPCFPRDARLFQYVASSVGLQAPLAVATDIINDSVVDGMVLKALKQDGNVGILGMAYKPGTSITDESPGSRIHSLLRTQRIVKTHDPMAPHSHSLEEVLACPILIVAAAWPEYEALSFDASTVLVDPMRVVKKRIVKLHRKMVTERQS